ncbi:pyruvate, phosphate dikinase [Actinomycetospora sp. TBRC 11914]|uniref:pyruvate, phosphate dikinase n=1 Tax=Actinomycetospora sp. TBRC 11914 TaxID=2729387 RepID=UPI00145E562E|nr:pyruvate, phosphate dikinase [Actinomycetospora sp. TBRC 11914]NMO90980.1 pyruvate, phosphate dikinase [Actinomycetospora sp. TBRC 11914]
MSAPGWTRAFTDDGEVDVELLGGKGAGLVRMTRDGLRVPPGCVVVTTACHLYLDRGALPDGLVDELRDRLSAMEAATGRTFGTGPEPLLVSVRSGAPVSMPGMMDTVLNLGLSREAAIAIAERAGDTAFMADLVARFHAMYSEIVLGALDERDAVDAVVARIRPDDDPADAYERVWAAAEAALDEELAESVPAVPDEQLRHAVEAVFRSWNTRRARTYREHHGIPHDMGTAVVVQAMVFGNLDDSSGSGVVFTRNPVTGEPGLYGEYLAHSQGEDVVAGTRTPDPVARALPAPLLRELEGACAGLEARHGDVLDVEFTVERGVVWFLQVRSAKRTPEAAVRIAADLLRDGTASPSRALSLVTAEQLRAAARPGFDGDALDEARAAGRVVVTGIGACPGQVSGELVLDPDRAKDRADAGADVVLARAVTSPADLHGMIAARGIVTATGGSTSHAAVVARALGTACVVGAGELEIDAAARTVRVGERVLAEGDPVSLDGASGELVAGALPTTTPAAATEAMDALLTAATQASGAAVLARVTVPADVVAAREAGATGIVTAVDDVLAASGDLNHLVETLLEKGWDGGGSGTALDEVRQAVARQVSGLLAEAGGADVDVRAIDLLADESRELLQQTAVTTRHPELALPLGVPALVAAQRAGLALAAAESGYGGRMRLAVRHVSDPAEVRALAEADGAGPGMGTYLTSPRAVLNADALAAHSAVVWLEVRALQAAMFGIPARQFLTAAPLDSYVARGLLSTDPRHAIDPSVEPLLAGLAEVARAHPDVPVGVRLSGTVSDAVAAQLYALGFRRFAVDLPEVRPLLLGLGRAALAQ